MGESQMTKRSRSDAIARHAGGGWRMWVLAPVAILPLLALGACGSSTQDRALSGGAIGAAAGGAAGLLLDEPLAGALLGGAAGAAAGALTDEDQIDLGKPVWR
jgi:osmotically inducible lipoprotein OsmB